MSFLLPIVARPIVEYAAAPAIDWLGENVFEPAIDWVGDNVVDPVVDWFSDTFGGNDRNVISLGEVDYQKILDSFGGKDPFSIFNQQESEPVREQESGFGFNLAEPDDNDNDDAQPIEPGFTSISDLFSQQEFNNAQPIEPDIIDVEEPQYQVSPNPPVQEQPPVIFVDEIGNENIVQSDGTITDVQGVPLIPNQSPNQNINNNNNSSLPPHRPHRRPDRIPHRRPNRGGYNNSNQVVNTPDGYVGNGNYSDNSGAFNSSNNRGQNRGPNRGSNRGHHRGSNRESNRDESNSTSQNRNVTNYNSKIGNQAAYWAP